MSAEMMSAFNGSMRNIFGPVQKMNDLVVAHLEKVVTIQMESVKNYTNLGIAQMKAATEVNDLWSFFGYVSKQRMYVAKLSEQFVSDAQKISELGGNFMEKAQSVAQEKARAVDGALGKPTKAITKKVA